MKRQRKNPKLIKLDHVPFDIQTIIIKKLPAKSLIRFRCVSKQWKSLIQNSEFIKNYQSMNDPRLLVRYNVHQCYGSLTIIDEYVSFIDNDTFPQHMSPMTVPLSIKTLKGARALCYSCGLICFHGYSKDHSEMVVFWNPSIRKSVSVLLKPPVLRHGTGWFGFGVSPKTCDPKLVMIDKVGGIPQVHVYTLSTRAWKKVCVKSPHELCHLMAPEGVCVEGCIYWLERDDSSAPFGNGSYCIVSFDLCNDEFGKVSLPRNLQQSESLLLSKWNECLIMSDYSESDSDIYDHSLNYWVMKVDGVAPSFTKMFNIEQIFSKYPNVLEVTKNGKAIMGTKYAPGNGDIDPILKVYDPCSGHVNDIRIPWSAHDDIEKTASFFSISSYMETLLLLDQ